MHVTVIIAGGGAGRRMGAAVPKQFLALGGESLLLRSIAAFDSHPSVADLIVVLPPDVVGGGSALVGSTRCPVRIVSGGTRRQDSVANAFDVLPANADVVVVHDAARPFVSAGLISRTIDAAVEHGAAIAALPASDTVKRVSAGEGVVVETLRREEIFLAQTPQAFRREILRDAVALGRSGVIGTDEATLAERAGHKVRIVAGDASNIKITTKEDFEAAGRLAAPARTGRAGTGYDLHRLVSGRPLVLGGVQIASDRGAVGHSDADVICHAATDAILGAACLGDIGQHFPDSDPRWKDSSSLDLLSKAAAMVAERGFEIGNLDVTVVLESPKLREHIDRMRAAVAGALGIDAVRVSIKAKTNEGIDAIGRGEAIAAHAVALLRARLE